MRAVQSLIQPFIHPRTAMKFKMTGSDWSEKLKEMIDDDQLPIEYGGTAQNPF